MRSDARLGRRLGAVLTFVALSSALAVVRLLPIDMQPMPLPGPDLMLCLVLAWTIRRPDLLPVWLVAVVMLAADLLLMRPPGLWAAAGKVSRRAKTASGRMASPCARRINAARTDQGSPGKLVTIWIVKSGKLVTYWMVKSGKLSTTCHSPQSSGKLSTNWTLRSGKLVTAWTLKSAPLETIWTLPFSALP